MNMTDILGRNPGFRDQCIIGRNQLHDHLCRGNHPADRGKLQPLDITLGRGADFKSRDTVLKLAQRFIGLGNFTAKPPQFT